jgi:hypothetical protein
LEATVVVVAFDPAVVDLFETLGHVQRAVFVDIITACVLPVFRWDFLGVPLLFEESAIGGNSEGPHL